VTTATIREEVRVALEELAARNNGRLTPEEVIAAAKPKSSPLHDHFTWDDKSAAHMQRLYEARELIRSVRVTTVVGEVVTRTIAYVRDPEKPSDVQGYISTAVLRTEADLARAAIVEEFGRAASAMRRALAVAEALQLRDEVQEFVDRIQSFKQRVEQRAE
jgi:hypothetical protein